MNGVGFWDGGVARALKCGKFKLFVKGFIE
nr:MAG TPA: hypothetical protein [Caudoviricetes sp.]